MKTFKQFVTEQQELDEKMGKVGTAIAAGLLGAVAGHSIATHKSPEKDPVTHVVKHKAPKKVKKKPAETEQQNTGVDAGVIGALAQM